MHADESTTAYLIVDTESCPDGDLLSRVKYAGQNLDSAAAIARAQAEAVAASPSGSDFLPVTFQFPVAACVIRVAADYTLQAVTCLDAPRYRPREIVDQFWRGVGGCLRKYSGIKLVTFNGRGFDLPLLELAAFRYGLSLREHFNGRKRFDGWHFDLMDWMSNFGAYRMVGGLNLLSKLLGQPGKMDLAGDQVYRQYCEGNIQQINDYCMCDTLDTYFVFLRTRVLVGDLTLEQERSLVEKAKLWLEARVDETPGLTAYLTNWGDWKPWP